MPYTLNWYDDTNSIIYITGEGSVTWDEHDAIYDEAQQLVNASPYRVDLIADPGNSMPPGNPLPHFSQLIKKWANVKNFGNLYVVRNSRLNGFVQGTTDIAGRIMNIPTADRIVFVTTLPEALNKIRDARAGSGE